MIRLALSTFLVFSMIAVSGCLGNLSTPSKGKRLNVKIDYNLPFIDSAQIRYIADLSSIAFEWNMIRDYRIKGYVIYRSSVNDKALKQVAFIDDRYSTHYVDKDLTSNSIYLYQFATVDHSGAQSQKSEIKAINTLTMLEPVAYAHAVSNLPRKIKILWRPHSSKLISTYIIYKNIKNRWEEIAKVPNRLSVEYIDNNLRDNASHSYKVYALTFNNIRSKPSKTIVAKTKPLPHRVTKITTTKNLPRKVNIIWSTSEDDISYFNIYRSSNTQKNFKHIGKTSSSDTSFTDIRQQDGAVYFYKISITDTDGLEGQTKDVTGVLGQTLGKPSTPIISYVQLVKKNEVTIKWENHDKRIKSFTLIKKHINNSFFSKAREEKFENIKGQVFKDGNIQPNFTYKYHIYGVDEFGIISLPSPESIIVIPKIKSK